MACTLHTSLWIKLDVDGPEMIVINFTCHMYNNFIVCCLRNCPHNFTIVPVLLTSARLSPMAEMAALSVARQPLIHSAVSILLEVSFQ